MAQKPFVCQGQYFLSLTKNGSNSSGLYEVKISQNGQNINLVPIQNSIGLVLNGMGYRITDNFIYGMDPIRGRLRRIGSDGIAFDLGVPKDLPQGALYYAGDVTPDGRYLLLVSTGTNTPQIVKVDLDDPNFQCTSIPLRDRLVSIVDVAFDPFTGVLYGNDIYNKRLVIVDPVTGNVNIDFPIQPLVDQLGALFSDSFGNLYGYGSVGIGSQDKFVSINKKTGVITPLAEGPPSVGQDGCSCPYTLELQKTVTPQIAYPCTEVIYSFIVSNGSGIARGGIALSDTMPKGLKIKSVIKNPFGGKLTLSDNFIKIEDMNVTVGIDTIKVLVEVAPDALGLYRNQALLTGLPLSLGSYTYSDNPATLIEKDSTDLLIKPLDLTFIKEEYQTCPGGGVLLDATLHGLKYLWSDGDTSSKKWLTSPGTYHLKVSSLCEKKEFTIQLYDDQIALNITKDVVTIELGDEIDLNATYLNSSEKTSFLWSSEKNPEPKCPNCVNTSVIPHNDGYYILTMDAGKDCILKDSLLVRVLKDRSYFAANIISVNGDGNNDRFFLNGKNKAVRGLYLRIYDRWGNLVFNGGEFSFNDESYGWDGLKNGVPVNNGVFVWQAALEYLDGFIQIITGDITVIK
ncbi:MAG: gliding motility-associated C-terminal domain-containing protein [Saprospiraceae bacterium]|jgi:gliding motility-associated-like protein|nr:gliding motility-associated C-terminal domain-containing protein [Saprospiraceae bacterium]